MEFPAIRSRLADSGGRLYWRSLGEIADTPEFREYLHREFPQQASEWNDPKGRRQFLKLMGAALAMAGLAVSIWPDVIPGRVTIWQAATAARSQQFMLYGTVVMLPLILAYTAWSYWIFRGKVGEDGYH